MWAGRPELLDRPSSSQLVGAVAGARTRPYGQRVLAPEELEQLLELGHESRSLEVKGSGSINDGPYVAKIAKAVMAMGNLRDGGIVCLGVGDKLIQKMEPGLSPKEAGEWSDYDNVTDGLGKYSDPPVTFELHNFQLSNGKNVVVLEVAEFERTPHVCKRGYEKELQKGNTYVRPRGKPQSVHVPSHAEMRELLDLATDKEVREFIRRSRAAGIGLEAATSPAVEDQAAYVTEATDAWGTPSKTMSELLELGHFDVSVRPTEYAKARVSVPDLANLVTTNTVRLRGWPVPYVDGSVLLRRPTSVGEDIEPTGVPHMEAWRMCASGQFLHRRVLTPELRQWEQAQPSVAVDGVVVLWEVLFYLVEVAELGARMATSLETAAMTFDVSVQNIANRELVSGDWSRELHGPYVNASDELEHTLDVTTSRLVAEPRTVGVELGQAILQQFGLGVPDQVLLDWQASTLRPTN